MSKHKPWLIAGSLVVAASGLIPLASQVRTETAAFKSEEFLVLGNANRGSGESAIAVSRVNPDHIVMGAMSNLHRYGDLLPDPVTAGRQRETDDEQLKAGRPSPQQTCPGRSVAEPGRPSDYLGRRREGKS